MIDYNLRLPHIGETMNYTELSGEQMRTIIDTVTMYGTVALAARNAGISPGRLRWLIENDAELNAEIEDALAVFKDAIRLEVLNRATVGKSDAMLKLAAESFAPETFKPAPVDPKARSRPSGLVLRSFDDGDNNADTVVPDNDVKGNVPPEKPKAPLLIEVYAGL